MSREGVTNWAAYNDSLRQRGDVTVWLSADIAEARSGTDYGAGCCGAGLLDQFDAPVTRFMADGAYDGAPTRDLLTSRFGKAVEIVIPPPWAAMPDPQSAHDPSHRDRRIAEIRDKGRMAWQVSSGYNQRSRVETLMGRWKTVIGPKLKARNFANQKNRSPDRREHSQQNDRTGRPVFEVVV